MVLLQESHGWRELQGLASKNALVSTKMHILDGAGMDGEHEKSWFAGTMGLSRGFQVRHNRSFGANSRETKMEEFVRDAYCYEISQRGNIARCQVSRPKAFVTVYLNAAGVFDVSNVVPLSG